MKIKIGDLTNRQIAKICLQRSSCYKIKKNGCACPLYSESEHDCMVRSPALEDYNDIEVDIPEDT